MQPTSTALMDGKKLLPYKLTSSEFDLVLRSLESIGGPRALAVAILFRYGQCHDALKLGFSALDYNDPRDFAKAWQAHRLLAKADFLDLGLDQEAAALSSFIEAERKCQRVNHRLRARPLTGRAGDILSRARLKISHLLGDLTRSKLEVILGLSKWGDGSTSSCKGRFTQRYNKIGSDADYTPQLQQYINALSLEPWFPLGLMKKIPGNTVCFVPKNFKTHRSIASEPTVNSALQRGVGEYLVGKLRRWGVNTRDQRPNQRLARLGSIHGDFSTIDLASASDTISRGIVELLIPPDWLLLLETLRSPCYTLGNGEAWTVFHKFSSMGNSFTFELETLVFASIVLATMDHLGVCDDFAVYGDDIVCSRRVTPYVIGVLKTAGFMINSDKTFTKGPFRESCGEEFYLGQKCTPFYLRNLRDQPVISRMTFANWLRGVDSWFMERTSSLWVSLFTSVPRRFRLLGPASVSNVFHSNEWDIPVGALPGAAGNYIMPRPYGAWYGYRVETIEWQPLRQPRSGEAGVIDSLLSLSAQRIPRDAVVQLLISRAYDNTARMTGKWVRRPVLVSDWPVVRELT